MNMSVIWACLLEAMKIMKGLANFPYTEKTFTVGFMGRPTPVADYLFVWMSLEAKKHHLLEFI